MPDFYSDRVAIRAPGHSIRVNASVYVGAVAASGAITGDAANDTLNLAISVSGGSIGAVVYGQEVVVTTSTGAPKLRTHVRYAGTISAGNLPIRELSYGTAQIVAGDLFQVLNEHRLHDRLVTATATFDPDALAYTDEGDNPSPVCNSGGAYAAYVDGYLTLATPHTYATVQFTGDTSFVVAPASSGAHTHAWRFPAGSTPTTSSSANPSAQIPVGSWLVEHDFTDTDNGKTTTQYVPVIVHDATHQPYDIMIDSGLQADAQYGWHYTVRVFQDASLTDIPDGSLVILWTNERINNAWQSFRNAAPGRETILAVGYTHRDDNKAEAAIQRTTFDVVSPMQRLDEVCGYSKVMEESATPDQWSKLLSLTVRRGIIQDISYYSTLNEAGFDLIFDDGFLDQVYPALYLQRSTPVQQVRELAHGVDAVFQCDRSGRFNLYTALPYVPLADRAAITTTFILANEDVIDFEFARDHYPQVELMKTAGFSAGTSPAPIFSLYPGSAPGEAVSAPTNERLICDSQTDLNERTGRYGAQADNVFIDADGVWQRAFELSLTLFGSYDFFDFYSEYVAFSIDGSSNLRGVDISTFRFSLKSVSVEYNGGTARTKLVLQAETNAPAGTTYTPAPAAIPTPYVPPPLVLINPGTGLNRSTIFALNTDGYLYYCGPTLTGGGFSIPSSAGGPAWLRVLIALVASEGAASWSFDAFCPAGLGTGTEVRGWLATYYALYRVTHAENPATITFTQCLTMTGSPFTFVAPGLTERSLASERGTPNRLVCVSNAGIDTTWMTTSVDGVHWADEINLDAAGGSGTSRYPAAYVSPRSNLMIASTHANLHQSTAATPAFGAAISGLTFATGGATTGFHTAGIHFPFNQPTDNIFYVAGIVGSTPKLYRGSLTGGSLTDITPILSATPYTGFTQYSLQTSPANRLIGCAAVWSSFGSTGGFGGNFAIVRTLDGGDSWTVMQAAAAATGLYEYAQNQVTDNNTSYHYGYNNIGLCENLSGAAVIDTRMGDIPANHGTVGQFVAIWGG